MCQFGFGNEYSLTFKYGTSTLSLEFYPTLMCVEDVMKDICGEVVPFGECDLLDWRGGDDLLQFIRAYYHPELSIQDVWLQHLVVSNPPHPWWGDFLVTIVYQTRNDFTKQRGGAWKHVFHMYTGATTSTAYTQSRKRIRYPD